MTRGFPQLGRLRVWLSAIALSYLVLSSIAFAQSDARVKFSIPAQPAAKALETYAKQAGIQILFPHDQVVYIQTQELSGEFTRGEALSKLLNGTGLKAEYVSKDVVSVRSATESGSSSSSKPRSRLESPAAIHLAQGQDPPTGARDAKEAPAPDEERRRSAGELQRDSKAVHFEGIVVTARKRDERLIDVPISMAVVTREDIDRRGLVNAEDYLRGIAGVNQVGGSSEYAGQAIVIRGMETSLLLQNFFSGPTAATYFGETPTTNSGGLQGSSNIDIKLVDIERVEVLRGPQGTAFGSSSLGGAVRTIPVAPKLDRFEGKAVAGYSVTGDTGGGNYSLQAVVNIPVVKDKLAIRAVAYQYEDSGFYRNRAGSDPAYRTSFVVPMGIQDFVSDADQVGSYYVVGGRVAALFQATDNLRLTLNYLKQRNETNGFSLQTSGAYAQLIPHVAPEHVRRGQKGGFVDYDIEITNGVMEYDLGWADLLATYSHLDAGSWYGVPYPVFNLAWAASGLREMQHRLKTGEIRLATKFDGAWNFLAGLYAERIHDEYSAPIIWYGDLTRMPSFLIQRRDFAYYLNRRDLTQKAAFGEVSWKFLPGFTLTGGGRAYAYDRAIQIDTGFPEAPTSRRDEMDLSDKNFRVNLSYKPNENSLLYTGWAQGFRLGRPQPPLLAGNCDVDRDGIIDGTDTPIGSTAFVASDSVDSYEIGGKFTLLDRRLTLDAAVFHMDWTDIPISRSLPSPCLASYIANAGKARSRGVEFQASYNLTKALRVDFGGSYINAELSTNVPSLRASAGARLPGSPKLNANVALQYQFAIAGFPSFVRADAIYVGSFYSDILQVANSKAGGYVKLDATARVAIRNLNIDFFVRNLTNEDAFTYRGGGLAGYTEFYGHRLRPRTIGVQLGYQF